MKAIKTIYNNCGWFLLVLIFGNILLNFFAPNSLIGQENINLVCLFLKIKAISAIVLAFFMIMFMIKSAVTFVNEKGYGLGHKIVGVVFSCFVSILWMNFISVQSQYSTYGIKNLIEEISVVQKISNGSAFKKTINLTKQDDNISVYTKKSKKSSYPSRFQGVQATQLYNFYGVYADSDKLKVYNESINTQLRLSLSKSEFDYYNDLIKSANNNDEFQIEFYTDKDGKNLGYIESIQLVEKKISPSYSENISVKENSDLYTVTKSDNSELENICWLIVKDGEIQKIVDASEINEFKLRKDVPEGVYTVLLCTDYDSTTHSYTQVSNAIEIII